MLAVRSVRSRCQSNVLTLEDRDGLVAGDVACDLVGAALAALDGSLELIARRDGEKRFLAAVRKNEALMYVC